MLVFIGAIRHPKNSNNYDNVLRLLKNTLTTITSQTNANFTVIIVCNVIPKITIDDRIIFIKVDFDPPSQKNTSETGMDAIRKDRATKYIIGIIAAQEYNPDYIMIFDTDDYVSNKLSEFVNKSGKNHRGWYIHHGYIMDHANNKKVVKINQFDQYCGTSLIINNNQFTSPELNKNIKLNIKGMKHTINPNNINFLDHLNIQSSTKEIMSLDHIFLFYILGSHKWTAKFYQLKPLPFPGAIWNWNTGENHIITRTSNKFSNALEPYDLSDFSINQIND